MSCHLFYPKTAIKQILEPELLIYINSPQLRRLVFSYIKKGRYGVTSLEEVDLYVLKFCTHKASVSRRSEVEWAIDLLFAF